MFTWWVDNNKPIAGTNRIIANGCMSIVIGTLLTFGTGIFIGWWFF